MGASISVHPKFKYTPNFMNYVSEWDAAAAYGVNDVVRVMPGVEYKLPMSASSTGAVPFPSPVGSVVVTSGYYMAQNGHQMAITSRVDKPLPGTYICVCNVPAFSTLPELESINVISPTLHIPSSFNARADLAGYFAFLPYIRLTDINYFPAWPESSSIAVLNPDNLTKTRGRYWELLSLLPTPQQVCRNGEQKTIYVDAEVSTSGSYLYTRTY
jgi:hypothetical protein